MLTVQDRWHNLLTNYAQASLHSSVQCKISLKVFSKIFLILFFGFIGIGVVCREN